MKRFISFLTALSMTLMFFMNIPINVSAETISGTGYSFDTTTGVMTITENNDVTFYNTPPFSDDISIIKDVKFGENVTMISYGAFYGCTGLTSVIIPNNVTYISTNAFALCDGIKQAFFPASAQTQPSSFPGCPRAMYEIDADGNVVINSIGYSKRKAMVIPNVIEGVGTVVSVADTALWVYISPNGHDHFGGTATCQKLAQCAICGTGHGDFGEHTLVDGVCSVCGSIAINETNFPDANFRAYVSRICDGDRDGYLTKSECDSVTAINVSNNSISDLKGIEYFTKLDTLSCANNQLTSLDIGKNTALTVLECYNNKFTSLDVSSNTKLQFLHCDNNQLTSLDLSSNTALQTLNCTDNKYAVPSCVLEPAALPGEFDISKASGWTSSALTDDNKILYLGASGATYTYDCGNGKTASFNLTFRPHNCTKTEAQDATCTDDGNIEYYSCSVCGYKFGKAVPTKTDDIVTDEDIVTNATHHDYGSWTITEEPTLTETGEAERVCANDSTHKEKEFLPVLTDTSVWTKDETRHIEPTEENTGKDVYTSEYGEVEITLPPKMHTHTLDKTEEKAASCTEDGNEAYWTCSVCHKMFSDENGTIEITAVPTISSTGHTFAAEWSNNETNHWHTAICEHIDEKRDEAAHTWNNGVVTIEPTEEAEGEKTYTCTVCNYTKTEIIPKLDITDTETTPDVTEPPVTDPSDTGSTGTEPPVTDPSDTGSAGTEPPVTEPSDTEPIVTVPPVTEPIVTAPPVTEPPVTEPVITAPPYIPYFPPNNTAAAAVPIQREPYLQNENGKIGWDVISDNIWETPDGETVHVNMNGTVELPKNIVSDISGRDIDLVLIMNGGFVWTINGMSVTKAKTVDMSVRKRSVIPQSTVKGFAGNAQTVQLDLRHNGDLGFIAKLTVYLGNRYSGMYANSYCYKSRNFEFGDSSEIAEGYANLRFTHASSWLITIDDFPALEDVSTGAAAHSAGSPIDMTNSASSINIPDFIDERKFRLSNKKRRYRILKKRRLDDLVFVF